MFTTTIDNEKLQTFADILEHVAVTSRTDDGAVLTTTGRHPVLGHVVMVQGPFSASIVSETSPTKCAD